MGGKGSGRKSTHGARNAVGNLIRSRRNHFKIKMSLLARQMGFTIQYLSNVELGIAPLSCNHYNSIMHNLNISREELFKALCDDLEAKFVEAVDGF